VRIMKQEPNKDEALKADESQIEVESPTTEELPPETESEEVVTESTEEVTPEVSPEVEGRKTASSRIRELVAEKKEAEAKAESLAEQVRNFTAPQPQYYPPSDPAATEVTVDEVLRRSDALTQIRLAQQENLHRVNNEAIDAIKAYPELDPDSESFDKDLSESISQATLAKIQVEPTASVRKFVDSMMKPYRRSLDKQASGQAETITRQVSQQAMRPTQVSEQEKPFAELSIEEMEDKLGPKVYK
jgi:hypothetical protein